MKASAFVSCLRVLAVMSSASLLGGYVWFTQRSAQSAPAPGPVLPPEEVQFDGAINYGQPLETKAVDVQGNSQTIILGTKNISQPIFSTRKVESAVHSVLADISGSADPFAPSAAPPPTEALGKQQPPPATDSPAVMPGSKGTSAVVTPDSIDALLQTLRPASEGEPSEGRARAMMPGSKSGAIHIPIPVPSPASSDKPAEPAPAKRATMMPGSKSYMLETTTVTGVLDVLPETHSDKTPNSELGISRLPQSAPSQPSPAEPKP